MGKQWKQWQILFSWVPKITADGDCSLEIKRHLLLGRKAMTNPDSVFKSRDITLLAKVHLVKAMVFPVVMCGCESCTVKKAAVLSRSVLSNSLRPWTLASQAPLPWGFSRQEYYGLAFPPPGDLPNLGFKPRSQTWQADSLPSEPPGKPY